MPAAAAASDERPLDGLASFHKKSSTLARSLTSQSSSSVWGQGGLGVKRSIKFNKSAKSPTAFGRGRAPIHHKSLIDSEDYIQPSTFWKVLMPFQHAERPEPSLNELMEMDDKRKRVLALSRQLSPIDSVAWISLLRHTALPRIHQRYATWAVYAGFILFASISRSGMWAVHDFDPDIVEGGTTVVTFMITFYVSYCYNRYCSQFADTELLMRTVINVCKFARVHFHDPDDVHRLWRYLNLQHAIAYCGLTDFYNVDNFLKPLADKYGMLGLMHDREEEEALWRSIDLDAEGLRACAMYEVWSLDVVRAEAQSADNRGFSAPIHSLMVQEVMEVGNCVKRLYAYTYQVLPFIYTHLVSSAAAAFLMFNAFIKGMYFTPDATWTFGFWMPVGHVLLTTFATFGLLEVGSTILDPFGRDPEDFAITHLVEWTAVASLDAIAISKRHKEKRGPKIGLNTYAFDSVSELRAATTLAKLVARWKTRFRIQKATREQKRRQALRAAAVASDADYDEPRRSARLEALSSEIPTAEHPGRSFGRRPPLSTAVANFEA